MIRPPDVKIRPADNRRADQEATGQEARPSLADLPACSLCPLPSCGYPPCRLDVCDVEGVCRVADVYCQLVEAVTGHG